MASITDVAKKAGVGVGTVSRVMSGKGYVSDKTKAKVLEAVKELNYVPNEVARSLSQKRSNTIAIIVPNISNFFYSIMVNEIEHRLRVLGFKTLLGNSFGEKTNEKNYLDLLDQNLVDGIITASNLLTEERYANINKPVVSLDSILSPDIPMVCSDHTEGGRQAARMLIDAGCRHVLQFRDSLDAQIRARGKGAKVTVADFPYALRHIAFEETIKEAGIRYDEVPTNGAVGMAEQRHLAEVTFSLYPDVDGLMATDIIALQYAHVALAHGRRIPEDLKVVAYDGTDLVKIFYPPLNAIVQPVPEIAERAVDLLTRQINGEIIEQKKHILPISTIENRKT